MGKWNSENESLERSPASSPVTKSNKLKAGVSVSCTEPLKDKYQTPEVPNHLNLPTSGVVRIAYCETDPLPRDQNFRPWHLEKVAEVTEQLARDGRRVIGHRLGIVMSDGITLCWVDDSTVRSMPANDELPDFYDKKNSICNSIMVSDIEDFDEGPQWASLSSRTRYTVSQVSIGATYIELLPGQTSVGTLSSPLEYTLSDTLSRRMSPIIVGASADSEPDPNGLPCHGDHSIPADDDLESMDCDHPSPEFPGVSTSSECSVGISGRKHTRSRLSRMLDDDYSTDEDFHETSSEDERLPALSEAIPIPLLGTHVERQDHHGKDASTDSDPDDAYVEGSRNACTMTGSAFNQSSLPRRHPINTSTTTRKRSNAILLQRGRNAVDRASSQVPLNSRGLSEAITTNLPKSAHGKARRILSPRDENLPLVTISMRADINYIDRSKPNYPQISLWSTPHSGPLCHVDDAVTVENTIVLGYSLGPYQVSLARFTEQGNPQNVNLTPQPHGRSNSNNQAVSSLTPIEDEQQRSRFASGGYDKRVYIWDCSTMGRNPVINDVRLVHNSFVSALAYRKVDHCLLSAAGSRVYETNLGGMRPPKDTRLSNNIHQIHIHPQDPNLTFMELNHLDCQVCIYDRRQSGFDRSPCVQFGYRSVAGKFNKPEARHTRGSVQYAQYVRGHKDGTVKLWDFRNIRSVSVVQEWSVGSEVAHTIFCRQNVTTIGSHVVHVLNPHQ